MAVALQQVEQELPVNNEEEIVLGGQGNENTLDLLDDMFADLEAGVNAGSDSSIVVAGLQEKPLEVPTESQLLEAGHAANIGELKEQALAEMDEQSEPAPDTAQMPAPVQKKKAPITKRISTIGMTKSVALATALGDKLDELLTIDTKDLALSDEERFDKRIALLETIDKMPIKIGEKTTNLFAHIAKGAALSNYTRIAINFLVQNDEMSSKQLKDAFLARPYSEGTSSSQTTQMMNLLPALGIAIKSGGRLIPNPTSTLLPLLTSLNQPGPTTGPVETEEDAAE
jgi:hypothetical protein